MGRAACAYTLVLVSQVKESEELQRMNYVLSSHATAEMARRAIPLTLVESVLTTPDQKVPEHGNVVCYQSTVIIDGKRYLLRVMMNETVDPPMVVTVYRTSKIDKYWSTQQ